MNVLDENVPESQRALPRSKRVAVRQIGLDLGRKGMKDDELIPLLHQLDRPTFFTLDGDFYDRRLCLSGIVWFTFRSRRRLSPSTSAGSCGIVP